MSGAAPALAWSRYIDALLEHGQERTVDSWLHSRKAYRHWRALHIAKLRVLKR